MPYITRDDGEHFVIPAYRDVLGYANKGQLKKDILALSEKYGQYITLQKRGPRYEAAFSPDTGYLLGESVWLHFKRPPDMVYCEALPNKAEAILVVVKEGSIYLDGQFPLDGIAEELIVFLTQQNQFAIYVYGDVPISKEPEVGKFSFEPGAVKSFEVLAEPAFAAIKPNRNYQLRLVDVVLKAHNIGVFPTAKVVGGALLVVFAYMAYYFYEEYRAAMTEVFVPITPPPPNPYAAYEKAMQSPAPNDVMQNCLAKLGELTLMPGWIVTDLTCSSSNVQASVVTAVGGSVEALDNWVKQHGFSLAVTSSGLQISQAASLPNRKPMDIYPLQASVIRVTDDIMRLNVNSDSNLQIEDNKKPAQGTQTEVQDKVKQVTMTLKLDNVSPTYCAMLAERMANMPVVINEIKLKLDKGAATGSITFDILGT